MAIKFTCPHCHKPLSVKDQLAGKKGNCPLCKRVLTVPKAADAAAPTAPPAAKAAAAAPAPAPADVGRPAPTTQSHTTPPGPTPVDSSPSARSPGTPNRSVPPRQAPLTQPAPRGYVPADTAPAPSPEPTPAGAAWLSTILAGILVLVGAALALYTLARPFLPAH